MEVMTQWSVCSELFAEKGESIPRILPCFNTLCEGCIKKLLKVGNSFNCPYCKNRTHEASKGQESFPENKYILAYLRNKVSKFDRCQEHDRKMSMFCKDAACEKPICSLCLFQDHNQHVICDIVVEQEVLADEICEGVESTSQRLQVYKADIESLQKEIRDKFVDLENKIKAQRKKMNEVYDEMIEDANKQMEKQTDELGGRANSAEENVVHLFDIRENVTKVRYFLHFLSYVKQNRLYMSDCGVQIPLCFSEPRFKCEASLHLLHGPQYRQQHCCVW